MISKNLNDIVLISPDIKNSFSGVEIHSENLYKFLKKINRLNSLISFEHKFDKNMELEDGVLVKEKKLDFNSDINLTGILNKDKKIINLKINSVKKNIFYFLNNPSWIHLFEDENIENLIIRSSGNDIINGWIYYSERKNKSKSKNKKELVSIINKKVKILIVNSIFTKKELIKLGIDEKIILIIQGGIKSTFKKKNLIQKILLKKKYNISRNKKIIINATRFVKFKGIENTIYVINELKKRSKLDFIYILIGDGPLLKDCKKLVQELNLEKEIIFKGYMDNEQISKYLGISNIFLHLPIVFTQNGQVQTETMGRSICEAMASGLPIISTNVGGVPELIKDNENGYLITKENHSEIAQKLEKLLNNDKLLNKNSIKSKEMSVKFYWKNLFQIYKKEVFKNE